MTNARIWRTSEAYRAATDLPSEEACAEQVRRRRAARWHAWLKSPECTFQDRENFERWCSDATNRAAYAALCDNRDALSGHTRSADDDARAPSAGVLSSPGSSLRFGADAQ